MSTRRLLAAAAAAALITALGPVAPAFADDVLQAEPTSSYSLTAGRAWSLVAAALGLIGIVAGSLALARTRTGRGVTHRRHAVVGLATGLAGALIGGLVVGLADGGPGSGSGIVGGFLAVAVGLVATLLAALALGSRPTSQPTHEG